MNNLLKQINTTTNLSLTGSQSSALEKIDELLSSGIINCAVLKGSAGTGKTTLLKLLTNALTKLNIPYRVCTPTGRAAQILRSKGVINVCTIHSMIYAQDNIVEEESNGDLIYFFNLKTNIDPVNTIYLIDESSMISNQFSESELLRFGTGYLLSDLLDYISINNDNRKKILFVGDKNQLPPVNSSFSPCLDREYLGNEFPYLKLIEIELNQIVRQVEDSGIIRNANIIKENLETGYFASLNLDYNTGQFKDIDPAVITNDFCNNYEKNKDSCVLVSYTNASVSIYNRSIREKLFNNPTVLERGDRIIVLKNNSLYQLLNGEMAIVTSVSPQPEIVDIYVKGEPKPVKLIFRNVNIETANEQNQKRFIPALILENLLDSAESTISKLQQRALLAHFRTRNKNVKSNTKEYIELLKNDKYLNCLLVKYGYAITCHKSQGGEWNYVYFDFKYTSSYNSDYLRFCYTAITRAKDVLYAINSPKSGFAVKGSNSVNVESSVTSHILAENQSLPDKIEQVIREKLSEIEIKYEVTHKNYLVRVNYLNNSLPRFIDIFYKKTGVISKINSNDISEQNIVFKILKDIEGLKIVSKKAFTSEDPFLVKLNEEISAKLEDTGIEIENVESYHYQERYYFTYQSGLCSVNIHYNKKNQVSSILYHEGYSELAEKIIGLLV